MSLYDVLLICLISYICFDMCSISMMFGVSLYNKLMSEVSAHCVLQNTRRHLPLEALCGHVFLTCLMSGESFYSPSFDTNVTSGVLLRKAFLHLATVFCLQLAFHKHIFVRWWSQVTLQVATTTVTCWNQNHKCRTHAQRIELRNFHETHPQPSSLANFEILPHCTQKAEESKGIDITSDLDAQSQQLWANPPGSRFHLIWSLRLRATDIASQ